jgi:hypothetical protein
MESYKIPSFADLKNDAIYKEELESFSKLVFNEDIEYGKTNSGFMSFGEAINSITSGERKEYRVDECLMLHGIQM